MTSPAYCRAEIFGGRVTCCPLVSHSEYAGGTDGSMPDCYVTLSARRASIIIPSHHMIIVEFFSAVVIHYTHYAFATQHCVFGLSSTVFVRLFVLSSRHVLYSCYHGIS